LERLNNLGLGLGEYFKERFGADDPGTLKFAEKVLKAVKLTDTLAEMRKKGDANVGRFIDDTTAIIPKAAAPALTGPTEVYFRDLMKWTGGMWSSATEGMNIIGDGIGSGKVDTQRL